VTSTSNHHQTVAEEAILDHFRTHEDPFHSDDLWHVIPDEHRGVISLAVMALVNKKLIVGCGYRKSAIPSRKRSPSQEYRLTELGRDRVVGVGAGSGRPSGASTDPGDTPKEVDSGSEALTASLPAGVDQGEGRVGGRGELSIASASAAVKAPGPASLDKEPARLFEPAPEPPRSAWTDAEAA
jgi:hypothetical protein